MSWSPPVEEKLPGPVVIILSAGSGCSVNIPAAGNLQSTFSAALETHFPIFCIIYNFLLLEPCQEAVHYDVVTKTRTGNNNIYISALVSNNLELFRLPLML